VIPTERGLYSVAVETFAAIGVTGLVLLAVSLEQAASRQRRRGERAQ
jgi:hypothetical protein